MSAHLQTLKFALEECRKKLQGNPQFQPLLSIDAQLQYLIGIAEGTVMDRLRLKDIIVGIYAAREFETRDMAFANLLYDVQAIADSMKEGKL